MQMNPELLPGERAAPLADKLRLALASVLEGVSESVQILPFYPQISAGASSLADILGNVKEGGEHAMSWDVTLKVKDFIVSALFHATGGGIYVAQKASENKYFCFVLVGGCMIGVVYFSGGVPYLIRANEFAFGILNQAWQSVANSAAGDAVVNAAVYGWSFVPAPVQAVAVNAANVIGSNCVQLYDSMGKAALYYIEKTKLCQQIGRMSQAVYQAFRKCGVAIIDFAVKNKAQIAATVELAALVKAVTPKVQVGSAVWRERATLYREFLRESRDVIAVQLERNRERREQRQTQQEQQEEANVPPQPRVEGEDEPEIAHAIGFNPEDYICPIVYDVCQNPVRIESTNGVIHYFEQQNLIDWMRRCRIANQPFTHPVTRAVLPFVGEEELEVDVDAQALINLHYYL